MPGKLLFKRGSYEWGIARRVEESAQLIQDLRAQESELNNIQSRLLSG